MKGKIILIPVSNPVGGMQVVAVEDSEGTFYNVGVIQGIHKYNRKMWDVLIGKTRSLPYSKSELKQIVVEHKEIAVLGGGKDKLDIIHFPLHPDDWEVAIALIGHEIEFDRRVTPKVHGEVAKLSLPTPVHICQNCGKTAVEPEDKLWVCKACNSVFTDPTFRKNLLIQIMEEDKKDGLYKEETWPQIFAKCTRESKVGGTFGALTQYLVKNYHPPKRK